MPISGLLSTSDEDWVLGEAAYFPDYQLLGAADGGFLLSGCGWMYMFCVDQKAL